MGLMQTTPRTDVHSCSECVSVAGCAHLNRCIRAMRVDLDARQLAEAQYVAPPSWQVYARIGGGMDEPAPRVIYKGTELTGVTAVEVATRGSAVVLTLEVFLPSDAFVQMKGVKDDYRTRR